MAKKTIPRLVEKKIKEYLQVLKNDNLPITDVFVFGSYPKGKQTLWSDIDLCVISPKFKNPWSAMQYLWQKRLFDPRYTIEPIGFSPKDFQDETPLIHEIKTTGISIPLP